MTSTEKATLLSTIADDIKAEEIEVIDVRTKTSMADYFVICAGTSDRHVVSIADRVIEEMKAKKVRHSRVEGENTGWVLVDYGDVIFHVMREEQRQFYDLEAFWKTKAPDPSVADS